ncbi:hypothetical protein [Paenibacillus sp. NPDC057934]|uniref:hypothetical protein n=1 Tax=Paenibacillus sp. NPDC057934 TaxID=3346282 RepID=UPI0036D78449
MKLQIHNETNSEHQSYIENKMFEFNMMHFPDDLKGRYQVVNLFLKDEDEQIYGGLELGFEVFGTLENAGRHTHYYLKKDI